MTFTQSVSSCFKKYFTFSGRANKSEFWYFVIFFVIGEIVFTLLEIRAFYIVWTLLTIIPLVTVTIRRLHDTDKGALWILVWFIPIVGWLFMLYLLLGESDPGFNRYGEQPF
ncbi:MAG: DUF805 domain-containing protein [Campylobacter sp.]|nr:DUF805 domain-containing protein [Campylobacter sp.]